MMFHVNVLFTDQMKLRLQLILEVFFEDVLN